MKYKPLELFENHELQALIWLIVERDFRNRFGLRKRMPIDPEFGASLLAWVTSTEEGDDTYHAAEREALRIRDGNLHDPPPSDDETN